MARKVLVFLAGVFWFGIFTQGHTESQDKTLAEALQLHQLIQDEKLDELRANSALALETSTALLSKPDETHYFLAFEILRNLESPEAVRLIEEMGQKDERRLDLAILALSRMCSDAVQGPLKNLLHIKQHDYHDGQIWTEYNHEFHGIELWKWFRESKC